MSWKPKGTRITASRAVLALATLVLAALYIVLGMQIERALREGRLAFLYVCAALVLVLFALLVCVLARLSRVIRGRWQEDLERLRLMEEQYRAVLSQSGVKTLLYDIRKDRFFASDQNGARKSLGRADDYLRARVAKDGLVAMQNLLQSMRDGVPSGKSTLRMRESGEAYAWMKLKYTLVFGFERVPEYGVILMEDVTNQREREIAYEKWKQELAAMPKEDAALFEWNLTRDKPENEDAALVKQLFGGNISAFDARTRAYSAKVHPDDRQAYLMLMTRERLLGAFGDGHFLHSMEYRELLAAGFRWMRVSVQLVPYPDSVDVKAYIIVKNIDNEKRAALALSERSSRDALTGALNRAAFIERVNQLFTSSDKDAMHALYMVDLNGFKHVNDTFGHLRGDKLLSSVTESLRGMLRDYDLLGRVGGDEFMLCLPNIQDEQVAARRARELSAAIRLEMDDGSFVTGSIGVALFPRDGTTFEVLYRCADKAMYRAKRDPAAPYALYSPHMSQRRAEAE